MSKLSSVEEIRKNHNKLYKMALAKSDELLREGDESSSFFKDVDNLIEDIKALSATTKSFDDYQWLSDAAIKWQVVFSSNFNRPKTIKVSIPTNDLSSSSPIADRAFSEEEIEDHIEKQAVYTALWRIRETGRQSSPEEMERDSYLAKAFFISEILNGKINFASRIASYSYWRLEDQWLKEIKRLNAYFVWLKKGARNDPTYEENDYYEASEHIRNMLVNHGIKAQPTEFKEPRTYMEKRYLTSDGELNLDNPETKMMIGRKAYRISEKMHEKDPNCKIDDIKNWIEAETYVKMFYENIIPSVLNDDPENVLNVLKAFQFSKTIENRYHVINCFEAALAIYFINPDTIQKLWDESANHPLPDSCVESIVEVHSWPTRFDIPKELKDKFLFDDKKIVFKGVMSEVQKSLLLNKIKEQSNKEEHSISLDKLFIKSRLIHRETTL